MAEHLIIKGETKAELYATLLPQLLKIGFTFLEDLTHS